MASQSPSDLDFRAALLGKRSEKERRWCSSPLSSPTSEESRCRSLSPRSSSPLPVSAGAWSPPLHLVGSPAVQVRQSKEASSSAGGPQLSKRPNVAAMVAKAPSVNALLVARPPKDVGWQEVRRRSWRKRPLPARRHDSTSRSVPKDLIGRCFNCFAKDHVAAVCRNPTRCFRCNKVGHTSVHCKRSSSPVASPLPAQRPSPPLRRIWVPAPRPSGRSSASSESSFSQRRRVAFQQDNLSPPSGELTAHVPGRTSPLPTVQGAPCSQADVGGFVPSFSVMLMMNFPQAALSDVRTVKCVWFPSPRLCATWSAVWSELSLYASVVPDQQSGR